MSFARLGMFLLGFTTALWSTEAFRHEGDASIRSRVFRFRPKAGTFKRNLNGGKAVPIAAPVDKEAEFKKAEKAFEDLTPLTKKELDASLVLPFGCYSKEGEKYSVIGPVLSLRCERTYPKDGEVQKQEGVAVLLINDMEDNDRTRVQERNDNNDKKASFDRLVKSFRKQIEATETDLIALPGDDKKPHILDRVHRANGKVTDKTYDFRRDKEGKVYLKVETKKPHAGTVLRTDYCR